MINQVTATSVLNAPYSKLAPVIDGVINECEWQESARSFRYNRFGSPTIKDDRTVLMVKLHNDNLYFAVRCYQDYLPKSKYTTRDAGMWFDDTVEIFLQPDRKTKTYYQFIINPVGNVYDGAGRDASWNNDQWQAKSSIHKGYWEAEMKIPAKTIGLEKLPEKLLMGFNSCRHNYEVPQGIPSSWSPVKTATYHDLSTFGILCSTKDLYIRAEGFSADLKSGITVKSTLINPTENAISIKSQLGVLQKNGKKKYSSKKLTTVPAKSSVSVELKVPVELGIWDGYFFHLNNKTGASYSGRLFSETFTVPRPVKIKKLWNAEKVEAAYNDNKADFKADSVEFILHQERKILARKNGIKKERLWWTSFDFSSYSPGKYHIDAIVKSGSQTRKLLGTDFIRPPKPEWWDSKLGLQDIVLKPWTSLVVKDGKVDCWGRTYDFHDTPVVRQIMTQGVEILDAPVRISGKSQGKDLNFTSSVNSKLEKASDTTVVYENIAASNGIKLGVKTTTEYDGMIRFDVTLNSNKQQNLDELAIDIPIKAEYATLFEADPTEPMLVGSYPNWNGAPSGLFPDKDASGVFTPHIFIGNDNLGLVWFAESPKNWANRNPKNVLQLLNRGKQHILRMNIVDYPIALDQPLTFTFGLQATPVKPMVKQPQIGMWGWYGMENGLIPVNDPEHGLLCYPAAGLVSKETGSITVNVSPNINAGWQWINGARDARGVSDTEVISIDYPNGERFGVYYGVTDRKFHLIAKTEHNDDHLKRSFTIPKWLAKDFHKVNLSWDKKGIRVTVDGKIMAQRAFDYENIFTQPISVARISLGGGFTYDSIKCAIDDHITLKDDLHNPKGSLKGKYKLANGKIELILGKNTCSLLDIWHKAGKHFVHIHEHWNESQGAPVTRKYVKQIKSLAEGCNSRKMQLLPYVGFQLGDNSYEYKNFGAEFRCEPYIEGKGWNRGDHLGINICHVDQMQNFMIYGINKMINDYKVGGLYMDATCMPPRCQNLNHGCGYIDRNGKLQPSYPIFKYRKFFKRIRTIAQTSRPDFWMEMHSTAGIWTPVSSFGNSIWKGEQYTFFTSMGNTPIQDVLDLNAIRAGMGKQYGLPICFLNYGEKYEVNAICSVLDIPLRDDGGVRKRIKEFYKLNPESFVPYYRSKVKSSTSETPVSYFKRPDGAVIAVVAYLGKSSEIVYSKLTFPEGLIQPGAIVSDAASGERLTLNNMTVNVKLKPWRYRYILIAPPAVQAPLKPGFIF